VVDVRPIGMSNNRVAEENLAIADHNVSLIQKAKEAGKSTTRLRLKHSLPSIIEYPCGNKTVELIRDLGLSGQFQTCIDMGPKHFAAFLRGDQYSIAIPQPIFDRLKEYADELRILQRKLDRQRRANNPDHYNTDGAIREKEASQMEEVSGIH
jgi:hypothetical protein